MSGYFDHDDFSGKSYDARLMGRLFGYLKPYMVLAVIGIVLGAFAAAFRIAMPVLQGLVVRDLSPSGKIEGVVDRIWLFLGGSPSQPLGNLLPLLCFLFLTTILIRFVIEAFQLYVLQVFGQKVIYDLRMELFDHLLNLPIQFYHKNPVGRLVTRVSNDIEALSEFVATGLTDLTSHFFRVIAISIALPLVAWQLGLIALALLPLVIIASLLFRHFARKAYRLLRRQISYLNAFLAENIAGMSVIRAFSQEKNQREKFDQINEDLRGHYIASIRNWALYSPTVSLLEGLSMAVIIYYGYGYVTGGELSLATLTVFIWLIGLYYEPIRHLAEKYNLLQSAMASSERIFRILDTPPDPALLPENQDLTWSGPPQGKIEFRDVTFGYDPDQPVLRGVNFTIQPGETVALVGHTGAGKSSLIKLLLRFYDAQGGQILIDGRDLKTLPPKKWRRYLAVVPQDVFLFLGTIEENIRLWNDDISRGEVERAAQNVHAHRFIEKYPDNYQHQLKEGARMLSSGERQLLSFARALAYEPSVLILDEATALIDTQTEKLIQEALHKLIEGRTTIMIAHRLSTIQEADKILVLQKGLIVEEGNHQELLSQRGVYYGLYQLQ